MLRLESVSDPNIILGCYFLSNLWLFVTQFR